MCYPKLCYMLPILPEHLWQWSEYNSGLFYCIRSRDNAIFAILLLVPVVLSAEDFELKTAPLIINLISKF